MIKSTKQEVDLDRLELARTFDAFVRRLHAGIHAEASVRDKERIGPIGGMALMAVEEFDRLPMHHLVAHMGRDKSQMTRIMQQLETKGLVERAPSETDGRSTLISLTAKGRIVVRDLQGIVGGVLERQLAPLDECERHQLLALLRKTQADERESE